MLVNHIPDELSMSALRRELGLTPISLDSLHQLQARVTPISGKFTMNAIVDRQGMPLEISPEEIPGPIGERYREVWMGIDRNELITLTTGNNVKNGKAVGCTELSLKDGVLHATVQGIPYYALLAAKELNQGRALLSGAEIPSLEASFLAGQLGWGPAIAGGSIAVVAVHQGRRVLITQIKGSLILDGEQIHPFAFGGGLKQGEIHLGVVQIDLGTWREYLEEGGDGDRENIFQMSRTVGVISEGFPPEFRSFNHVLQRKDGKPITLDDFIERIMLPYTNERKPGEPHQNLEVRGWHILDIDEPIINSKNGGRYSTGVSYVIDTTPDGRRVLNEVVESRRLVEPIGGVLASLLVPGDGYRNLVLGEARLPD